LPGLTPSARARILHRRAIASTRRGRIASGLEDINEAVAIGSDLPRLLAVRSWIRTVAGQPEEALDDAMRVIRDTEQRDCTDETFHCAIVNACNILVLGSVDVSKGCLNTLSETVDRCLSTLPTNGNPFRRTRLMRHMLRRASALLAMRRGELRPSAIALGKVLKALEGDYPERAMATALDLLVVLTKDGRGEEAPELAGRALALLDRLTAPIDAMARTALLSLSRSDYVTLEDAVEMRSLFRPPPVRVSSKSDC